MQGTQVRSLVREDSTCCGTSKPVCHNCWVPVLQLLKPTYLEPVLHNRGSHCNEKLTHHNAEQPLLSSTKESRMKATKTERPAQPKISKQTILGITNLISFSLFLVCNVTLCGRWNLSSPTRENTIKPLPPALGAYSLIDHWVTRGSPFCCFLAFGVFCPALLIFNQFLDQTLTLHEQSIPWSDFDTTWMLHQQTITGWKRTLHSAYYPLPSNIEYLQHKTRFFL